MLWENKFRQSKTILLATQCYENQKIGGSLPQSQKPLFLQLFSQYNSIIFLTSTFSHERQCAVWSHICSCQAIKISTELYIKGFASTVFPLTFLAFHLVKFLLLWSCQILQYKFHHPAYSIFLSCSPKTQPRYRKKRLVLNVSGNHKNASSEPLWNNNPTFFWVIHHQEPAVYGNAIVCINYFCCFNKQWSPTGL